MDSSATHAHESSQNYTSTEIFDEMDQLNAKLEEMKESVLNTSVRAHLLEVELATLYSPEVAASIMKANQDCGACRQELGMQTP